MTIKTVITSFLMSLIFAISTAANATTLSIHPSGSLKTADYLCIYDLGCFNLKVAASGKEFKVDQVDFTELKKFVVMNMQERTMSTTALNTSCSGIVANKNQKVTIDVNVAPAGEPASSTIKTVVCRITG